MPEAPKAGDAPAAPDVLAEFRKLLREQLQSAGSGTALTDREERLLRDNYKVRDRLRKAQEQLATAGAGKPKDGEVVLSKEDADTLAAFKALNVKVTDLPTLLQERTTLLGEKAERDAATLNAEVAESLGVNPRAFQLFAKANGLKVAFKDVKTKDEENPGKFITERVPVIVKKDAKPGEEPELLADVLERDYAADIPLLTADVAMTPEEEVTGYRQPTNGASTNGARDGLLPRSLRPEPEPTGTRFPVTRSTPPSGANRTRQAEQDAVEKKRQSGAYSI